MLPSPYVWVRDDKSDKLRAIDIGSYLQQSEAETLRSKVSIYNRGPRIINSYVEFFDQKSRFPKSYGEAWTAVRVSETPTKEMGYQILSKEFVNRCYVWAVAGLCGETPKSSVIGQFHEQFK